MNPAPWNCYYDDPNYAEKVINFLKELKEEEMEDAYFPPLDSVGDSNYDEELEVHE